MKSMLNRQAFACALLACAAGTQAAPAAPSPQALMAMSPAQRDATFRQLAATKAPAGTKLDQMAPVLTGFTISPPDDVAAPHSQVRMDVSVTDNLSGVESIYATLTGPHGQWVIAYPGGSSMPLKSFSGPISAETSSYLEPGTWVVTSVMLGDAANNFAYLDAGALAALGNPNFQVVNSLPQSVDYLPPTLKAGKVLTPQLSVGAVVKGSDQVPAYFGATFSVADAGPSGISDVSSTWCLADMSQCIYASGWEHLMGLSKGPVQSVAQVNTGYVPGDYILYAVYLADQARNYSYLYGNDFGGATDFAALMPQGHVITLTP